MDRASGECGDSGLPDKARSNDVNEGNDREVHSGVTLTGRPAPWAVGDEKREWCAFCLSYSDERAGAVSTHVERVRIT